MLYLIQILYMIKIHDVVQQILFSDEEALTALSYGYMNLSQYAQRIYKEVGARAKKEVSVAGVVVALSRIGKRIGKKHPLIQEVVIKNITTKAPLTEMVYIKTPESIAALSKVYTKIHTGTDDFFTITLSTSEISVICSDRIKYDIEQKLTQKPHTTVHNLASIGLSFDPKYYPMPNITFSLLRKIALKRIPLAETITTRTEILFVFDQKYLGTIVGLFIKPSK